MKKKIENEESYEPQNEKNWFETEWDAMRIRNVRKKTRDKFYNFKKKREELIWSWRITKKSIRFEIATVEVEKWIENIWNCGSKND